MFRLWITFRIWYRWQLRVRFCGVCYKWFRSIRYGFRTLSAISLLNLICSFCSSFRISVIISHNCFLWNWYIYFILELTHWTRTCTLWMRLSCLIFILIIVERYMLLPSFWNLVTIIWFGSTCTYRTLLLVLCRMCCDMIFLLEYTVGYTWAITTCGGTTGMSSWHERHDTFRGGVISPRRLCFGLRRKWAIWCFVVGGVWVNPRFLFCGLVMLCQTHLSDLHTFGFAVQCVICLCGIILVACVASFDLPVWHYFDLPVWQGIFLSSFGMK